MYRPDFVGYGYGVYSYNYILNDDQPRPTINSTYCHVRKLVLNNMGLNGRLPSSLAQLSNLTHLVLEENNLFGSIPESITMMQNLQFLNLADNKLTQLLPSTMGLLKKLKLLCVASNQMNGTLPILPSSLIMLTLGYNLFSGQISSLLNLNQLKWLGLQNNNFVGTMPSAIGFAMPNMVGLYYQFISAAFALSGPYPSSIGNMRSLEHIDVRYPYTATSSIPSSYCNLTSLKLMDFLGSGLTGKIPDCLFHSNLTELVNLPYNYFTGTLPSSVTKMTKLTKFFLNLNRLTGTLPSNIGDLAGLVAFSFDSNLFRGSLPSSIGNMKNLQSLTGSSNLFTGPMTFSFDNMPSLNTFNFGSNFIQGSLSSSICRLSKLSYLSLSNNLISGSLPACTTGTWPNVEVIQLNFNLISGQIPFSFLELPLLQTLLLNNNHMTGLQIPAAAAGPNANGTTVSSNKNLGSSLSALDISDNDMVGSLPLQLFSQSPNLVYMAAASNCFSGYLPNEICNCSGLQALILGGLSSGGRCARSFFPSLQRYFNGSYRTATMIGSIPNCIFQLPKLNSLFLSGNALTGTISQKVTPSLVNLSLSYNKLEGTIPMEIQRLGLITLDLSYNKLEGNCDYFLENKTISNAYIALEVNRISGNFICRVERERERERGEMLII